ncbi:MAG: hypothetical protein J5778_08080 [Clostridiales bacterium]|nr:hypothetical protein [Clostridiales bacterium]
MSKKYEDNILAPDMSIEEFDSITDGVEDHVFSERYLARKEQMMKQTSQTRAKTSHLGIKIAVAAAALVVATPFVANAASNGELFARIWGKDGKKDIPAHTEIYVEEGKIRDDGTPASYEVNYPKVEYTDVDPETAEKLLEGKISTEPVVATIGDYKFTINAVVRDGTSAVVDYTIEKEGGVDLLNYSQLDNEAKGAWMNEDQNFFYMITGGHNKTYVDLSRSTKDKLYCTDYIAVTDSLKLELVEYTKSLTAIHKAEQNPDDYIKDQKTISIPKTDKISKVHFESDAGETIDLSAISMKLVVSGNTLGEHYDPQASCAMDFVGKVKITFKDGSEYLVFDEKYYDGYHDHDDSKEVANYAYLVGGLENDMTVVFNRLVDTGNIAKITVNETDYFLK